MTPWTVTQLDRTDWKQSSGTSASIYSKLLERRESVSIKSVIDYMTNEQGCASSSCLAPYRLFKTY